jgi:hypothetical protein
MGRGKVHAGSGWGNLKEIDLLKDWGVEGGMILNGSSSSGMGHGLD